MSSLIGMLTEQLGGQNVGALSQMLGADEGATKGAMAAALPMILGAMARNSAKPDGANALHQALSKKHDGGVLDNLTGFLNNPDTDDGDAILGHVFGNRRSTIEAGVSKASGLDGAGTAKLMSMLAPVVMGALGRKQRQEGLDAGALGNLLAQEDQAAASASPAVGGLAKLLDRDADGSVADDIADLGKDLLGGLFK